MSEHSAGVVIVLTLLATGLVILLGHVVLFSDYRPRRRRR